MKNSRKFTAMVAALALAACSVAPMVGSLSASAANKITITPVSGDAASHTYGAYQIFKGTLSSDGKLSNIDWGAGINATQKDSLLAAVKAISVNEATPFSTCTDAAAIADVLAKETQNDTAITKAFADTVAKYLASSPNAVSGSDNSIDVATTGVGYYLVQDTANITANGAKTRYILRVMGDDVEVESKSSFPTVVKKVKENTDVDDYTYSYGSTPTSVTDNDYNDVADYNIGDSVPFRLYGTLPSTYADYKQYYYKFNDTLGSQFTAPAVGDIKVYKNTVDTTNDITSNFTVTASNGTISVECNDLKTAFTGENALTATDVIIVDYSAVLNNTAVLGLPGQVNGVNLEYSNNPNQESGGTTEKGKTPDDGVIVFTYGVDINKIIGGTNDKLANAQFALYKMNGTNKVYLSVDSTSGKITELTTPPTAMTENPVTNTAAGIWVSTTGTNIEIAGLDAGTYYIEELAAPEGYNKLNDPIKINVVANMTNRTDWTYNPSGQAEDATEKAIALNKLTVTKDAATEQSTDVKKDGKATINVENKAGSSLPSTGGMGTTLFYLVGGVLVAGAGVTLITKKRVSKNNK